jgi:putative flippase GtrA
MTMIGDVKPDESTAPARRKLLEWWPVRSLTANTVAGVGDYAVLLTSAKLLGLPTAVCAFLGLSVGLSASFLLNRRFVFRDTSATLGGALLRYVAAVTCLMSLHAAAVGLLTDRIGLHIVVAKMLCDATLLTGGQLLLLRWFVFPRNNKNAAAVAVSARPAELV